MVGRIKRKNVDGGSRHIGKVLRCTFSFCNKKKVSHRENFHNFFLKKLDNVGRLWYNNYSD